MSALVRIGLCCLLSLPVHAEVHEQLRFKHYDALWQPSLTLLQMLDRATPIQRDGRRFHGYAAWELRWHFSWQPTADGRCRIGEVNTQLSAEITLPNLRGVPPAAAQPFENYLNALREHELGHFRIAQTAARRVDQGIRALPEMASCEALEQTANALGQRLSQQARQEELNYDRQTQFGRTQGAWLPR